MAGSVCCVVLPHLLSLYDNVGPYSTNPRGRARSIPNLRSTALVGGVSGGCGYGSRTPSPINNSEQPQSVGGSPRHSQISGSGVVHFTSSEISLTPQEVTSRLTQRPTSRNDSASRLQKVPTGTHGSVPIPTAEAVAMAVGTRAAVGKEQQQQQQQQLESKVKRRCSENDVSLGVIKDETS